MKILIYGTSDTSLQVALQLCKDHDITILDQQDKLPEQFSNLDVNFVSGSGADVNVLKQAQVAKMDIFIACSGTDETNIVACWTTKRIADVETISFVRTPQLYNSLISYRHGQYRAPYDIDTVIWPEQLLTEDIFRIVLVPHAIDVEYFLQGRAKLFEYRIKGDSPILNKRIMDCDFPDNSLIVGITRENYLFIPNGSTVVKIDDKIIFMGTGIALDILASQFFQSHNKIRSVVLIGGGSVGFMLAEKLEQAGIRVIIIESDKDRCLFLANNLKKALVLNGDGTDFDLLESESVGAADAIICVTNNDEKNLLCSLLVKQISNARVITRVNSTQTALLFERAGVDVVVSPKKSALRKLINRVQTHNVDILALIESGQGEVLRITLPESFSNKRIIDLSFSASAIIGAIQRARTIIIPRGETLLQSGDLLVVFTMSSDAEAIKKMFAAK